MPKAQQSRLATLRREAFTAHKAEKAHGAWRAVADLARATHPKLAEAMDEAENDALAYMDSVEAFAENCSRRRRRQIRPCTTSRSADTYTARGLMGFHRLTHAVARLGASENTLGSGLLKTATSADYRAGQGFSVSYNRSHPSEQER